MKIRIDDIPEDGLHLSFSGDEDFLSDALNAVSMSGDIKIDPHIEGKLDLFRSDEDVLLVGSVAGSMNLRCSRCISEFIVVKQVNLDLKFRVGGIESEFRQSPDHEQDVMFLESATGSSGDYFAGASSRNTYETVMSRRLRRPMPEMWSLKRLTGMQVRR